MSVNASAQSFDPEYRRTILGASEVAAVLGLDKWRTPLDVYNSKMGLVVDAFVDNAHIRRGNKLESIASEYYEEETGEKLRRRHGAFIHPEFPFLVGHVDRIVVGCDRLLEIKCPSDAAFRKMQREGLPESYIVQAQMYMALSGYSQITYCIFCANIWDAAIFTIDYDQAMADTAIKAACDFWNKNVLAKVPPFPVPSDKPSLEFKTIGGDLIRRDDCSFAEASRMLREAAQIKADGEELYELAKQGVLKAIDDTPGRYEGGGLRLSYTETIGRKTFDYKTLAASKPDLDLEPFFKYGSPSRRFTPIFIES